MSHREVSSLHNLDRESIAWDGAKVYHDNINHMLKENFGFQVSESVDDENTFSEKEGKYKQAQNTKDSRTRILTKL